MSFQDEKRRVARKMCSDLAEVSFQDQTGRRICDIGVIEDVGSYGISISMNLPVPVDSDVEVQIKDFRTRARVRYCNLTDYSFQVGLEFAAGYEWSREKWEPDHLLVLPPNKREDD